MAIVVRNFDFGQVVTYDSLTTSYGTPILFTTTCNQVAVVNETDGVVYIRRDQDDSKIDALSAGKSRSYVNWGVFEKIELKYVGTQPTEGFVSVQACRAPYGG